MTISNIIGSRPGALLYLLRNTKKLCSYPSYYPEKKRKGKIRIFFEQLSAILRTGFINDYYFSYGFDVKPRRETKDYFIYGEFKRLRDKFNQQSQINSSFILRNKLAFGFYVNSLGIQTGKNVGLLLEGGDQFLALETRRWTTLGEMLPSFQGTYFVKLLTGECGVGIFKMECLESGDVIVNGKHSSLQDIEALCSNGQFLIQKTIERHSEMKRLYPLSVNTIRLVTVRDQHDGSLCVFPSVLRIGGHGSFVDNTSQGGLAVGVETETGQLMQYGFLKPQYGTKTTKHPDTEVVFANFTIPFFSEAKRQAMFLHSLMPDLASIGWDIAIGVDGPVFIEGNDNWEINGPQICHGGLKPLFRQYMNLN